jgi:hypothetical protein
MLRSLYILTVTTGKVIDIDFNLNLKKTRYKCQSICRLA